MEIRTNTIMIVDDMEFIRRSLCECLISRGYCVQTAPSGYESLKMTETASYDLFLIDINMPDMDGLELLKKLDIRARFSEAIMITGRDDLGAAQKSMELGAFAFIRKPFNFVDLTNQVAKAMEMVTLKKQRDCHLLEVEKTATVRTKELSAAIEKIKHASLETVLRLTRASEYRDEDTGMHIQRMGLYASCIARNMGLSNLESENLSYAAPMHDIGKIGTPDHILLKPGKLNADEWKIMQQHTVIGAKILEGSNTDFIRLGEIIALCHHEKWNGSGYPRRLKEAEIPVAGRIVAVADVFDALTSRRPYKQAYSVEKSLEIMKESRNTHFDPEVLDAFFTGIDEILRIRSEYKNAEDEHGTIGVVPQDQGR
jgi:putative two-component system response regulator